MVDVNRDGNLDIVAAVSTTITTEAPLVYASDKWEVRRAGPFGLRWQRCLHGTLGADAGHEWRWRSDVFHGAGV